MQKEDYLRVVNSRAARSPIIKNCLMAFLSGGLICTWGQILYSLFIWAGVKSDTAYPLVTVALIFVAALLTGIGVFDTLARSAGAGTLVPVTGFANAVVSPAIDNKSEGLVLGVGAKIFTVAGPVLLFGTLSGCLFGSFYYLFLLITG